MNTQIKELREKLGKTQKEFADLIEYSKEAVSLWERGGQIVPIQAALKIVTLCDTTLDYIYFGQRPISLPGSDLNTKNLRTDSAIELIYMLDFLAGEMPDLFNMFKSDLEELYRKATIKLRYGGGRMLGRIMELISELPEERQRLELMRLEALRDARRLPKGLPKENKKASNLLKLLA